MENSRAKFIKEGYEWANWPNDPTNEPEFNPSYVDWEFDNEEYPSFVRFIFKTEDKIGTLDIDIDEILEEFGLEDNEDAMEELTSDMIDNYAKQLDPNDAEWEKDWPEEY